MGVLKDWERTVATVRFWRCCRWIGGVLGAVGDDGDGDGDGGLFTYSRVFHVRLVMLFLLLIVLPSVVESALNLVGVFIQSQQRETIPQ